MRGAASVCGDRRYGKQKSWAHLYVKQSGKYSSLVSVYRNGTVDTSAPNKCDPSSEYRRERARRAGGRVRGREGEREREGKGKRDR